MNLYLKLEEKYGQKYTVSCYINGWGVNVVRIRNEYFELCVPENAESKNDFMLETYNLYNYSIIESMANAIHRIIKKNKK